MMTHTFPVFRTERCILRQIVQADLLRIFQGLSDQQVIEHYGVCYATLEETQAQMDWFTQIFADGSGIWWGVYLHEAPELLIGACGFNERDQLHRNAELGYWLLPEYWRQGLMNECLPLILDYAFGPLALHRVSADVELENLASVALLHKNRFVCEGVRRECEYKNGRWLDVAQYSRLISD
jgi:ribosomal-protein-alanine N-acetyltransferase